MEVGRWAIKGKPEGAVPEVGKLYLVSHSRKGLFRGRLKSVSGVWATFQITEGVAEAILDHNVRYEGEEVTCRDSLCILGELPGATP